MKEILALTSNYKKIEFEINNNICIIENNQYSIEQVIDYSNNIFAPFKVLRVDIFNVIQKEVNGKIQSQYIHLKNIKLKEKSKFNGTIDIENRMWKGKSVPCYIPKINGIPIMSEHSFFLKESILLVYDENGKIIHTKKTDNKKEAKSVLQHKIKELKELEKLLEKNYKFFNYLNFEL